MKIRKLKNCNKGISNIMGAILLIAVAVVAVSGIAVIVAEMQKSEMERQSNIESVEKENLRIMSIRQEKNESSGYMETLDITVINLNSRDSRVVTVLVNDKAAKNYSSTDEHQNPANYSFTRRLRIPAGESRVIRLNFTSNYDHTYNVSASKPLTITILSENANNFKSIFQPPKAIAAIDVETEDLGVFERDVLILDASESFDDGSIVGYNWTLYNSSAEIGQLTGKKTRISFNQTGPFYVDLEVTDDTNMIGSSGNMTIPINANFNPPARIEPSQLSYVVSDNIDVTVRDMHGNTMEGIDVSFISLSGIYTLSAYVDDTDATGVASVTVNSVTTSGVLRITTGRISHDVQITL